MPAAGADTLALRILLWLGPATLCLILAVGLAESFADVATVADETIGAPGMQLPTSQVALVGLAILTPLLLVPAAALLPALRHGGPDRSRRSYRSMFAIGLVALEALLFCTIHFADVRSPLDGAEASPLTYLVPLWLLLVLALALSAGPRRLLGLENSRFASAARAILAIVAGSILVASATCLGQSREPWREAVARLETGAHRGDVVRELGRRCSVAGHPDRLVATCRSFAPAWCACAPALGERFRFDLDDRERVARIRRETIFGPLRGDHE